MKPRRGFNPKRKIAAAGEYDAAKLADWSANIQYGGNPEHKKHPEDYGLSPPPPPRPHKTLCDGKRRLKKAEAVCLLQKGLSKGLVSEQLKNGWPKNIWSVSEDNEVFEAQLENQETGTYHGYPVPRDDDFGIIISREWNERSSGTGN